MTNDYKKNILDYMTNNVSETTGTNRPQFSNYKTLATSINQVIRDEIGNHNINGYISHQQTNTLIVYGAYSNGYGYICLFDTDLNKLAMITTFSTGSKLFQLKHLEQAEDGNFYGISQENDMTTRILLFNNFVAKKDNQEYRVVLRQSYIVPSTYNIRIISKDGYMGQILKPIIKVPDSATYYIVGQNRIAPTTSSLIKFVINVGTENEWTVVNSSINVLNVYDILIQKQTEEKYKLYMFYSRDESQIYTYEEMEVDQDNNISYRNKMQFNVSTGDTQYWIYEIVAKSPTEKYVAFADGNDNDKMKLGKIMSGSINILHTFNNQSYIQMKFDEFLVVQYTSTAEGEGKIVGILQDNVLYTTAPISSSSGSSIICYFIQYNMVNIYEEIDTNETIKWILDYNPSNYNGVQYSAYNQTVAKKGTLHKSGEMVFARNLYNNSVNNNTTTSTIQVPNTMLNNMTIVSQYLWGETNRNLVNNSSNITKNIYETLYVNFIRTLNVIDEDTNTSYPNTASYINQNINIGAKQNCQASYVGKVRINYENDSVIQNIFWTYEGTLVEGYYHTEFIIDATNEVPTLEFISKDESTTYITKELDITAGSYYLVKQKLRIGDD